MHNNYDETHASFILSVRHIITQGHHGLPGFPPDSWRDFPSEWDYLQYMCINEECRCWTVPRQERSIVFNRVFEHKDSSGKVVWTNMHGDTNYFVPVNPKEVPSLPMLAGRSMRQQLINMLNKQRWRSYHYTDFKDIQKKLYEEYGLLYELSIWVLPSLNYPSAWVRESDCPTAILRFGEIPWSELEGHGYHQRLIQPDLFQNAYEIWSFMFDLQTSRRDPNKPPDLGFRTSEQRATDQHELLFHKDPVKCHHTRARTVYEALKIRWQNAEFDYPL